MFSPFFNLKRLFNAIKTEPAQVPKEWARVPEPLVDPALVPVLDKMSDKLLFNYGNNISGGISDAYTVEKLSLWNINDCQTAIALKGTFEEKALPGIVKAKIKGTLLHVKSFDELDSCFQNGIYFHRKIVRLIIPHLNSEGNPATVYANMYLGDNLWKPMIEWDASFYKRGGKVFSKASLREDPRRWLGHYYEYNPQPVKDEKCFLYLHRNLSEPK